MRLLLAHTLMLCAGILSAQISSTATLEQQADSAASKILSRMTLRQKVYEMSGHRLLAFTTSMAFSKRVKAVHAGGHKKLGIPPTVFHDGPRGLFYYKGGTTFPVTMARGASWDPELEYRIGQAMAAEIKALGGNYSGAVCMNLLRHPAWGRAQETYGEDSYHVGMMATALTLGIQSRYVQACAKHYALNSMENNRFGGNFIADERTLHEVYLPHFKRVVDAGVASLMSAYNQVNGEYCGHNEYLLQNVLRKEWGFKGYVTSDWLYGLRDTEKGIRAGMNIEMPFAKQYRFKKVQRLIKDGKIRESDIDALVFPVVRTKLLFSMADDQKIYPKSIIGSAEHRLLAKEAAEKSAVLLKNDNQLLPLSTYKLKKIAVLGSLADVRQTGDHGSSRTFPDYIVSPLDGIKNYLNTKNIPVQNAPNTDVTAIRQICSDADVVVIVAGTTYQDEGEYIGDGTIRSRENPDKKSTAVKMGILGLGGDRKYLHLHETDITTIKLAASLNKKVIVCLVSGSAVTVEEWHEDVPSVIHLFYNGMEGGNALARMLFGEVNPSGKLPFTIPVTADDLPPFDSYASEVNYDYYHGYTRLDKNQKSARFPFGHGLSYTSFSLGKPIVKQTEKQDTVRISVSVKNTGNYPGAEVVQLYISCPQQGVERAYKQLKAFRKVYLEPGEEKQVVLTVPVAELAYYDTTTKQWTINPGTYTAHIGNTSENSLLQSVPFYIR